MNVLFLDIDGVLNDDTEGSNGHCAIDLDCVHRLNKLLQRFPDLKIVVSSDWREWVCEEKMTLQGLEKLLLTHAVDCEDRVVGITLADEKTSHFPPANERDYRYRQIQIEDWLAEHRPERYVVLDDHPIPGLGPHLIRVNADTGLTDDDVRRAMQLLNSPESKTIVKAKQEAS